MSYPDVFILESKVTVWRIKISSSIDLIAKYSNCMNEQERQRGERYHHTTDQHRFKVSRIALRLLLGRYLNMEPASIVFGIRANKKPFVQNANGANVRYNTAHSGDYILIAVAESEVGIDVEFKDDAFSYTDIVSEIFSGAEQEAIQSVANPRALFYDFWTRKEALLKATGTGLDHNLAFVPCITGTHTPALSVIAATPDWLVYTFEPAEGYAASIAYSDKNAAINFIDAHSFLADL